jgi:cyclase
VRYSTPGLTKYPLTHRQCADPELIDELALQFGSQCVVVAIDTKDYGNRNMVHTHGGRTPTEVETEPWAYECQERGAGEILLTSMDHDGVKTGFANELTAKISRKFAHTHHCIGRSWENGAFL